jgi:hypothetical protein
VAGLSILNENPQVDPFNKTRLDSHAVSCVVGYNSHIHTDSGKRINISAFTSAVGKLKDIPIVDAMILYECPYTSRSIILVINNALYVKENKDNLITPFLVREAGITLNETPKIQCEDPSVDDHSLYIKDINLRIHLHLHGIISYFTTRKPTKDEIHSLPWIHLTPDAPSWDPHTTVYERQEAQMLDFEGQIIEKNLRTERHILEDEEDDLMEDYGEESYIAAMIDQVCDEACPLIHEYNEPLFDNEFIDQNEILDPNELKKALNERLAYSKFGMSIGDLSVNDLDVREIFAAHQDKPKGITKERLSKVFRIDEKIAKRTIDVTTQRVKRSQDPTLDRRYSTNDRVLRYKRLNTFFFTDTFFATSKGGKSLRGNTCVQLFVTDKGYVCLIPMKKEADAHKAYKQFFKRVGVPDAIISDGAKAQVQGETKILCDNVGTTIRQLERNTPWANRAELYVGLIKRAIKKEMKSMDSPLALWDYCAQRCATINNVTAKNIFQLEGETPSYHVTGEQPDISNICQFGWYEWAYFRDEKARFPLPTEVLGRALGPAENAGNQMAQWILKSNGKVIPCRTCRPLKEDERNNPVEKRKRDLFDEAIRSKLGDSFTPMATNDELDDVFEPYEDDEEIPVQIPEADNDAFDTMLNAELQLPHGDKLQHAKVIRRAKDSAGNAKGSSHDNPYLDTRVYDVVFPDGAIKQYAANIIAENLYSQVDSEGNQFVMMDEVLSHRKLESALEKNKMYVVTSRGNKKLRKTTIGWDFKVLWKDGSTSWLPLRELKESNPVEIAEYSVTAGIDDEPAFRWWVPFTLKKRDVIISAVNQSRKKTGYKYGIKVPNNIKEAFDLDKTNGDNCWRTAVTKEMSNVQVAFDILEEDQHLPPGYSKCTCHIIFDVKMDGTRKARYVKDGHKTRDPEGSRYAGVVSRDSVRIALTYAALNDLNVMAADIRNAYLQAPSSEKHYIICGLEFGIENKGKRAVIKRALYGGKVSGRDFRNLLRSCMKHIGFDSCLADPDVWMRKAKKADGSLYWEYVLLYVDDALCISENAEHVLRQEIGAYFDLKEESVGPPDIYLGGSMSKIQLNDGTIAWSFSSSKYVKAAVANVETHLREEGRKLPMRASTPLSSNYRPELDISEELKGSELAYYQSLIGVLRWAVELGRVDICLEVSMMSTYLAMPREGHLEEVFHIFSYLKRHHNSEMVFDPSDPEIEVDKFQRRDWEATEFGELEEILPDNKPESRGMGFVMRAYVDADHASNTVTRRSRTGFIVYLNNAPIFWYSKKQSTIETSSFGSEFMAMKHCTEYIRGLRYKLRMMGIPCELPSLIYGDNQSVLSNTTIPDSVLKKKSNSIAYHFVREGCARDEWRTAYINTHFNPADLLTKALPSGEKRRRFINMILYHIFGGGESTVD